MTSKTYAALAAVCAAGISLATVIAPDLSYRVATPKGEVDIRPITSDIIRVTVRPTSDDIKYLPSQSAVALPAADTVYGIADRDSMTVVTPTTRVIVDRNTGLVSFRDSSGNLLLSEASGTDNNSAVKRISFLTAPTQIFYGAGERGHSLSLNGDSLSMYNRQNYGYGEGDERISQMGISVPWFSSDAGYGVLFDDYNRAALTLGNDSIVYTSDTPYALSYYFVNGHGSLAGNSEGYATLTGKQDLPPFWSLGYITSKYGYHNQDETLGAVDTLRRHGYPLDGLILDLYWYGQETDMGRLEWDKGRWPDHKGMLDSLKSLGVNVVPISQPYINKKGAIDNYNLLNSLGLLTHDAGGNTHDVTTWVGEAGMFDLSNPATREWLWNRLRPLTADGLAGWWGDLGEPEVHPLTIVHANGMTAEQYHNVYGNEWSKLIYDGLRKDFPDMRPLLLMRGGTAGLQRYSVMPWTTDVARSWEGFGPQVKLMLNSGLSGLGYMSSDIGGFAVDPSLPLDGELYTRWLQMGVFTPVLRTHAQLQPEPFNFEAQEDILRKFIKMRYEWLPYNYTLAYQNASKGLPMARPLNFRGDNPGKKYADITDEYLWGDDVLVAPVFKKGAKSRSVTFPAGEWIDWYNPTLRYKGGTTAVVKAPLERMPLFVKAGAFIPQYTLPVENTSDYNPHFLTVRYYPAATPSEYILFDDDRKSPTSLGDNAYQLTTFRGVSGHKDITVNISSEGAYRDMPQSREITLIVEDIRKAPRSISLADGTILPKAVSPKAIRQYGWTYDAASHRIIIKTDYNYSPLEIRIAR